MQVAGGISQVQGDHTTLEDVHEALSSVRDMAYHIDKHVLDPGAPKYVQPLDGRRARQPPPQVHPTREDGRTRWFLRPVLTLPVPSPR